MRIKAQVKYLHAMLHKAQENFNFEMNNVGNLETTKTQLIDLDIVFSSLVENVSQVSDSKAVELVKKIRPNSIKGVCNLAFILYQDHVVKEAQDDMLTANGFFLVLEFNMMESQILLWFTYMRTNHC